MPGVSDFKFRPCLFQVKYIPYFLMFGETKKSINGFFVVNEELTPNWWQNVFGGKTFYTCKKSKMFPRNALASLRQSLYVQQKLY